MDVIADYERKCARLRREKKRYETVLRYVRTLVAADDSVATMDRLKAFFRLPPYQRRGARR